VLTCRPAGEIPFSCGSRVADKTALEDELKKFLRRTATGEGSSARQQKKSYDRCVASDMPASARKLSGSFRWKFAGARAARGTRFSIFLNFVSKFLEKGAPRRQLRRALF
jgi:hypothetical protein